MRTLIACFALLSLFTTAARAADDQAVIARVKEFETAWNKDNTKAMTAIWAEDGSLINPFGVTAHGRAEVEKIFVAEHAQVFKGSVYETRDVKVQWVTPDVALVDLSANISGVHHPDGSAAPDYPHHVVWVLVKKDGKWMAAAARPYQFSAKPGEGK